MVGSPISSWDGVEGAYYAGSGGEPFWLAVAIAICVIALVLGSRHERSSYRKLK